MTVPSETPVLDAASLTQRQAIDVYVGVARLDERIARLIETIKDERKARDREREEDRSEVSEVRGRVGAIEKAVAEIQSERKAEIRSLGVWKLIGTVAVGLLSAAVGTEWFGEIFRH